jgi:hypothetical protein
MNALLEQAIAEVEALPDSDQEVIAAIIIEELKAEREWDRLMASTQRQPSAR